MNTDRDNLSYGQYLKSMRQEKGVSLEEISRETRIGKDILLSIEREDDAALPAAVFVKGFLKAYAEAVGIDGAEALKKYAARHPAPQEKPPPRALHSRPRRRWPLLAAVFGALGLLVFLSIFAVTGSQPPHRAAEPPPAPAREESGAAAPQRPQTSVQPAQETAPAPETVVPDPQPAAGGDEAPAPAVPEPEPPQPTAPPPAAETQKMTLEISAGEETWMKIIIDGGKPKEYTLNAGDRLLLEAQAAFNLLIGNAGGVSLRFNDRPVEIPGKSGQVITLQFP